VKSAFAVLHSETDEQVAVDMDYHRAMYDLSARVRPNETIVGWYSTGSDLNTYSALIQNFYSQETAPHQAVHVALDTGTEEGKGAGVKAYVRYVPYLLSAAVPPILFRSIQLTNWDLPKT
jgi:translation initiation factor 3 subunit F